MLAEPGHATTTDEAAQAARHAVATACRILAHRGLAEDVLGHVSVRTEGGLLVRCRGTHERGLLFTGLADVREVSQGGELTETGELEEAARYNVPNELPIHTEILRARPDVNSVVHVHPPAVVAADLAGLPLHPIVGAYNIPASRMASDGIPTYPRSVLVNSPALGRELADALGDKGACVMRGHGIVAVGATIEEAVSRALNIDALARMTLRATVNGRPPAPLPPEDLSSLPDLGSSFNDQQMWRFQEAVLASAGFAL
jgi:ribulose-5-phosphate 4-epimerase/fuculose-1-phosphate aldolase